MTSALAPDRRVTVPVLPLLLAGLVAALALGAATGPDPIAPDRGPTDRCAWTGPPLVALQADRLARLYGLPPKTAVPEVPTATRSQSAS